MGSTVVFLVGFHHLMTRGDLMEKRSLYFAGLAVYFPFPLALYFITDEVTRTPEPSRESLPLLKAESVLLVGGLPPTSSDWGGY